MVGKSELSQQIVEKLSYADHDAKMYVTVEEKREQGRFAFVAYSIDGEKISEKAMITEISSSLYKRTGTYFEINSFFLTVPYGESFSTKWYDGKIDEYRRERSNNDYGIKLSEARQYKAELVVDPNVLTRKEILNQQVYDRIKVAVDSRDYGALYETLRNNDNKRSIQYFGEITGVKLPPQMGKRLEVLQGLYPVEHEELMALRGQREVERRKEREKAAFDEIAKKMEGKVRRPDGVIETKGQMWQRFIDAGFTELREVQKGAVRGWELTNGNSFYRIKNKDEKVYVEQLLGQIKAVNSELQIVQENVKGMNDMDKLVQEYQKQVAAVQEKYPDRKFGEFQDGQVAINMLRQGVNSDELRSVIGAHTPTVGALHPAYENKIASQSLEVIKRYEEIQVYLQQDQESYNCQLYNWLTGKEEPLENFGYGPEDAYKIFAADILDKNPDHRLNGLDDQAIVARYIKEIDNNKEMIVLALKDCSPVAIEPGRDLDKYVAKIVELGSQEYEKGQQAQINDKVIHGARNEYKRLHTVLNEANGSNNKPSDKYLDGQIAIAMFQGGFFSTKSVIKAVELESATGVDLKTKEKDSYGYACSVVLQAEKAANRYAQLHVFYNEKNDYFGMGSSDVPVTMEEKYIDKISTALSENHDSSMRKNDQIVIVELLNEGYPRDEIMKVVQDNSPLAVTPGYDNYAEYIVKKAEEQISVVAHRVERFVPPIKEEKAESVVDEYKNHVTWFEKATGGKMAPEVDGKIVKAMIIQGYENKELISMVAQQSPCAPGLSNDARKYAQKIVKGVEKELKAEVVKEKVNRR